MELRHLRYFIAVAEELNFSRAAARLHVSQPPLSRQIRGLEAELKVKLLDRNTQGVRLTRAGHAVLARSRKLVCDAEALRAEAQTIDKESEEELRIGYAPSPTAVIISGVLARYYELSPGAGVSLDDLTHTEMLSGLRAGKLHAALTIRPAVGEMRGLKFETIRRHPVGILCSNSSPLARQTCGSSVARRDERVGSLSGQRVPRVSSVGVKNPQSQPGPANGHTGMRRCIERHCGC